MKILPEQHGTTTGYRKGCRLPCCREAHRKDRQSKSRTEGARRTQREQDYKKKYGITISEYEVMLAAQGGVCKLCGRPPKTRRLAVDHDHHTGRIRGLLCYRCNRALPNYVTREWLLKAADYIDLTGGNDDTGRADASGAGASSLARSS